MAERHMKRCSVSLIIRETQVQVTIRRYFTPTRMVVIKKLITCVGEDMEK